MQLTLRHSELDSESQIATDSFAPVPKCHSELDSESQIATDSFITAGSFIKQ